MERPAFQESVRAFVASAGLDTPAPGRVLDLVSEVGELAKEAVKATDYGRESFRVPDGWEDEVGDVFFSLVCLANETGVDLERALGGALRKYQERIGQTGQPDSGS